MDQTPIPTPARNAAPVVVASTTGETSTGLPLAFASGPIDPANENCIYQDGDDPLGDPIEVFPYNP